MVRPVSPGERAAFARKVTVAVTLLVSASAGLVALGAGASTLEAGLAVAAGLPVGAAVAWYVVPTGESPSGGSTPGPGSRLGDTDGSRGGHPRADGSGTDEGDRRGDDSDGGARSRRR
jgi:hypothetical protein